MDNIIDNSEVEEVMAKLESLEDEQLAVVLLREFNDATKNLGQLLMNKDQNLSHEAWKTECEGARQEVEKVLEKIKNS